VRNGVVFAGEGFGERGADGGILDRAEGFLAGADDVGAAAVVAFFGAEAADEAEAISHLAEAREVLTEAEAGDFGGDFLELAAVGVAGLHVERISLRRSACHPKENAVPAALRIIREGAGEVREPAAGASSQEAEGGGFQPVASGGEHVAPRPFERRMPLLWRKGEGEAIAPREWRTRARERE
jgi:hypothetical protein